MKKRLICIFSAIIALSVMAADTVTVLLPRPDKRGGEPLMKVLDGRHSEREFSTDTLSIEDMSNLLWAANGVNRVDGKRTAPSAMNRQEIDIYVVTADGAYSYNPHAHQLELLTRGDYRDAVADRQKFAADAPVSLILVGNLDRFGRDDENSRMMVAVDAGIVCENINLFCQSAGLSTVPRATMDKKRLAEVLMLSDRQIPILNNPVGYPLKK